MSDTNVCTDTIKMKHAKHEAHKLQKDLHIKIKYKI